MACHSGLKSYGGGGVGGGHKLEETYIEAGDLPEI